MPFDVGVCEFPMLALAAPRGQPGLRMEIACDGRALVGPHTGVGTWTAQVMGGLARSGAGTVHLAASRPVELSPELHHPAVRTIPPPDIPLPGTLWLHTVLPSVLANLPVDVFVASLAIVPRRCPVPAVAMVHDLTPRTHPGRHTLANRFCFNAYLEESLEQAAAVVVNSRATGDEVLATFPGVGHRLRHIALGVDPAFSPPTADDDGSTTRERFSCGRPYVLALGTIEPRKRIPILVSAWERLVDADPEAPDLVIAGRTGWGARAIMSHIAASAFSDRIHVPGYVPRSAAVDLLRHAEVFALVSEAEGFGLPLAEAICCGAPCVASDVPALREVGGEAALFVPSGDSTALADALRRALELAAATELRRLAAERAHAFAWQPIVAAWRELLEDVVGRNSRRGQGSNT
jgi:glycosyltransferase involved in cell wall biosynthesis